MDLGKADKQLRTLRPRANPYDVALGGSLSCRVATSGTKTLTLKLMIGSKQQRLNVGVYPAVTLAEAYEKAQMIRAQVKMGFDPRVDNRRVLNRASVPRTVEEAAERFIIEHVRAKNRAGWAAESERMMRADILPKLGFYPLTQLKRSDLAALISHKASALKAKGGTGTVANRLRAVISKFMGFCEEHGWLAAGLGVRLPRPAAETARERILSQSELGALWQLLSSVREGRGPVAPVYGHVLALLALTGCRCSEITGLKRRAVDLEAGTITVTDGKTAASNRTLALPAVGMTILVRQCEDKLADDLLFSLPKTNGAIPSNEVSRAARKLVAALGHTTWTPHDLRRTAVSIMAEAGIDGDIRRKITGHIAPDVHGRVYDRSARLEDMRNGLAAIEQIITTAWLATSAASKQNVLIFARQS